MPKSWRTALHAFFNLMCSVRIRPYKLVWFSLLTLFAPWRQARADSFAYTTIDVGPPPPETVLTSINDKGQIIGTYSLGLGGPTTSFLYDHGSVQTLVFALTGATADAINNAGQILGSYSPTLVPYSGAGFVYSQGVFTILNVPGSRSPYAPQEPLTAVGGINNLGQVVGWYDTATGQKLGYLYNNGTYTTINAGGDFTMATGINDSGHIVGRIGEQGFLDVNGQFTLLTVPGSFFTIPEGINNTGQIVGRYLGADGQQGFLYDHGIYYTVNPVSSPCSSIGCGASDITAINNYGQLVGTYDNPTYTQQGFEANLINSPEPGSSILLGSGLIGFTLLCRRGLRRNKGASE